MKKKIGRFILPILFACLIILLQYFIAQSTGSKMPYAENGVLNLDSWNGNNSFQIAGTCELYWNQILTLAQIEDGSQTPIIVEIPGAWNDYESDEVIFSGLGQATYHLHVTGADTDQIYGIRIPNSSSAYKLFIDSDLIAQSGSFEDNKYSSIASYVYQTVSVTPNSSEFDITLQMSNSSYFLGGLTDSLLFGTYAQVNMVSSVLSSINNISFSLLVLICLIFLIIFIAQHREKDMIILVGFGLIAMIRLMIYPNSGISFASICPNMSINFLIKIDYFTIVWAAFLFVYYIYSSYGTYVKRWHLMIVLTYSVFFTVYLLLPLEYVRTFEVPIYYIMYITMLYSAIHSAIAIWLDQDGAPFFFAVILFFLFCIVYYFYVDDYSISYFVFMSPAFIIFILFIVQFINVAQRYSRMQQLEMSAYKNQIHPHFFNNSLAGIISVARTDPAKSRELLLDMSSYLRGFYDYLDDDFITLSQELELVDAYVTLNKMRFGDTVKVTYQLEISNIMLPPLILEPLVENAFIHGLREKESDGEILIYTQKNKGGMVKVGVKDNGVGFKKKQKNPDSRQGVGIKNINLRLRKLYHTQLVYETPKEGGCDVYMEIPIKECTQEATPAD